MQRARPIKITDLNPHLMCVLCGGYYIDATTIIECLHSFCKSCIVRYLETNKYCPICDVQVHKTKPLLNIRQDQTLQDIVYKLVPGLYQNELKCRREFYNQHPASKPVNREDAGELSEDSHLFLSDEAVSLSLEYGDASPTQEGCGRRYLQCPAAVTVYHLQKLVRAKFGLNDNHKIELMYAQEYLPEYLSLMDVAYIYQWKRKSPIHLTYHILECQRKRIKLSHEPETSPGENSTKDIKNSPIIEYNCVQLNSATKKDISEENSLPIAKTEESSDIKKTTSEWKEVQLQISENGIMSVTDVQPVSMEEHLITRRQVEKKPSLSPLVNNATCVNSMLSDTRPEEKLNSLPKDVSSCDYVKKLKTETVKLEKSAESNLTPQKQDSSENSVEKCKISDNKKIKDEDQHPVEIKLERSAATTVKSEIISNPNTTITNKDLSVKSPIPIIKSESLSITMRPVGFQKVYPGIKPSQNFQVSSKDIINKKTSTQVSGINQKLNQGESNPPSGTKKQQNQPIRYKTLKSPTKPWNPSIPRSTMLSMKHSQSANHSKDSNSGSNETQTSIKPPRIFKMRNMPRFLGNPASGVKPMYQVAPGSELGNQSPNNTTPRSPKQGNTSITLMKIDPKTLSPIAMSPSTPQTVNSPRTTSSPPIQPNKFPPPFTPGSPKHHTNHFPNCRTSPHLHTSKKKTHNPRVPSPAHTGSLIQSNPFLSSVPHGTNPHLLYSGFPGTFSPTDPNGNNRLLTGSSSQLIRAMTALCPPSAAFHPSLPPSISMLFNPHHAHHRISQSERSNFKPISNECQKTPTPPPTVQRIPPSSGPNTKTPTESSQSSSPFSKIPEQAIHQTNMTVDVSESNSVLQNTKLNNIRSNHLSNELKKHSMDSTLNSSSVMPPVTSKVFDSGSHNDPNKSKELSKEINGPFKECGKSLSKSKECVNSAAVRSHKDNGNEQVNSFKEKISEELKTAVNIDSKEISVTSSVTINNNSEKINKSTDNNLVTELINRTDAPHHKS